MSAADVDPLTGLLLHDGCPRCGLAYLTSTTRCEKQCPNCGHRDSCHD